MQLEALSSEDPSIVLAAQAIGLDGATREFRERLSTTINDWLEVFTAVSLTNERPGRRRKEATRLSNDAARASHELRRLIRMLRSFVEKQSDNSSGSEIIGLVDTGMLDELAKQLASLSASAASVATSVPEDRGGRSRMWGFTTLVIHLGFAYEEFAGRQAKASYRADRSLYGGKFLDCVEVLLPQIVRLLSARGVPFPYPQSKNARGRYIYEITRRPRDLNRKTP
jgi:hypothetical protein